VKRAWLGLVLLLPGGCLIALGLLAAWPGLALLVSGLRRLSTAHAGSAATAQQPYGQPCQPRPPALGALPWNHGLHPILWTLTPPRMWAPSKEAN